MTATGQHLILCLGHPFPPRSTHNGPPVRVWRCLSRYTLAYGTRARVIYWITCGPVAMVLEEFRESGPVLPGPGLPEMVEKVPDTSQM